MEEKYYSSPEEFLATGIVGIVLYFVMIVYALVSVVRGFRSDSTRLFFLAVILMSVFELPRFFLLAINESYSSKLAYCAHTLAGTTFFIAFSIVCRQWSGLLQLGNYFGVLFGYYSLIFANIAFAIVDMSTVIFCLSSDSLQTFFDSFAYEIITFFEGIRNFIYSAYLSYYGLRLVKRFWHFSKLETQQERTRQQQQPQQRPSRQTNPFYLCTWCYSLWRIQEPTHVFHSVVLRLTTVLLLTTICFTIRMVMLVLKMIAFHSRTIHLTTRVFTLFGLFWFTLSDFIPRTFPTFAFIFLMHTKRPATGTTVAPITVVPKMMTSTPSSSYREGTGLVSRINGDPAQAQDEAAVTVMYHQEEEVFRLIRLSCESEDIEALQGGECGGYGEGFHRESMVSNPFISFTPTSARSSRQSSSEDTNNQQQRQQSAESTNTVCSSDWWKEKKNEEQHCVEEETKFETIDIG